MNEKGEEKKREIKNASNFLSQESNAGPVSLGVTVHLIKTCFCCFPHSFVTVDENCFQENMHLLFSYFVFFEFLFSHVFCFKTGSQT
jgi:hypothetical protein